MLRSKPKKNHRSNIHRQESLVNNDMSASKSVEIVETVQNTSIEDVNMVTLNLSRCYDQNQKKIIGQTLNVKTP